MNREQITAEAESFFEWDTDDRSTVTLTSCIFFAEHVQRTVVAENERLKAKLDGVVKALMACVDYGSITGAEWVEEKARAALAASEGKK